MRILLVDDDEALMETLAGSLVQQRYAVDIAVDGETAREFLALFTYDVIVLDMLLPDVEGISLCRQFREAGTDTPILILTAKDTSSDKVRALDAGADDYVIKPFDFDELCARIRALLRRESHGATALLRWGDLSLRPETFEVFYGEHELHATPKEYALLELMLRHPSRVFSLGAIIDNLWSFQEPPSEDAVRTHVKGLRQKLKAGGAPKDFIETIYGVGYRLRPLGCEVTDGITGNVVQAASTLEPCIPTKSDIAAAVANAWDAHKETMQERLRVLEAVAAALDAGGLSAELQKSGRSQAHKLAGALGCYGFPEGSRLACELEHLLQLAPLDHRHSSEVSAAVRQLRQRLDHRMDQGSSDRAAALAIAHPAPEPVDESRASAPEIWIVGASKSFGKALEAAAIAAGLCSLVIPDASEAGYRLQSHSPGGVLLWLEAVQFEASMALLEAMPHADYELDSSGPNHEPNRGPIVVITDSQDFHQRLQIVQHGVDRILSSTVSPEGAIAVMQQLLQRDRTDIKVMILDDDPQILDLLKALLSPWGFQLTTLDNPANLQSLLAVVQPDLLVLDVEMPTVSGLEICQVLRADEDWRRLPILFLTVHEETSVRRQAFDVGADDFISKSTMASDLPVRILNRLKR
ncbi:MAG: response regulator [Elainellaceae cyanobacterium]